MTSVRALWGRPAKRADHRFAVLAVVQAGTR